MIKKIGSWFMKIIAKKYVAGGLAQVYGKLTGYKTQISIALCVIVYILQVKGIMPIGMAEQLYPIIGTAGSFAFLQKIKRYVKMLEGFEEDIKK